MPAGVDLEGLDPLLARLDHARSGILDLTDANREAAQLVLRNLHTPHASGALDAANLATAAATGWGLANGQPYAPPVHWGTRYMRARPWLLDAARSTEDSWMDGMWGHVQQLLDK
jgi:hypothetical protein